MRVTKLILKGSKRLAVVGINYFEIDVNSFYQTIIGTNGSCKSYIISEMSALPAQASGFEKDGMKEFHCVGHNGSNYILRNTFDGKAGVHNFIVDGVDLNENGTSTIQKELVEEHFCGLTQSIFDVLIGKPRCKFSEMDTATRREWMMKLSGIDLELAMDVFKALKTRARDAQGNVKKLNIKLAQESDILLKQDELEALEARLAVLREDFDEALVNINASVKDSSASYMSDIESLNKMLEQNLTMTESALGVIRDQYTIEGVNNFDDLREYVSRLKAEVSVGEEHLSKLYREKEEIAGALEKLKAAGDAGLEEYETIINQFKKEIELVDIELERFPYQIEMTDDIKYRRDQVMELSSLLTECISTMYNNMNGKLTFQKTHDVRMADNQARHDLASAQRLLERIDHAIEHANSVDQVTCPKCSNEFKPGVRGDFDDVSSKRRQEVVDDIARLEANIKGYIEYMDDANVQAADFAKLENIQRHFHQHTQLWEIIGAYGLETNDPKGALKFVDDYITVFDYMVHRYDITKSMQVKEQLYQQASGIDVVGLNHKAARSEELDRDIENTITYNAFKRSSLKEYELVIHVVNGVYRNLDKTDELIAKLEEQSDNLVEAMSNEILNGLLMDIRQEISGLEHNVSTARVQMAIVNNLKETVISAKFEQDMYKALTDEMSPTDGLIADVLKVFIEGFVEALNAIIASVWTYPFVVYPCISNKDGLDYKFPYTVFNSKTKIQDIYMGSSAQVDIVDNAFKFLMMVLLNLQDFPLYLDEPISRMDEAHRPRMIQLIQSMVESNQCSQMFFISHFIAQHDSFPNAEVLAMDTSNLINLPSVYNQHVVIK